MRVLNEKETELIKLAVNEGIDTLTSRLHTDFKVKCSDLTVHQVIRLEQITDLLYTLFCEVVEENGFLQSEYEQ